MRDVTPRDRLLTAYQQLVEKQLIVGAEGNISERTAAGMTISAAGTRAGEIDIDSFVECRLDGQSAGTGKPSSEWAMHAAIYQAFPEAGAIVHTHSNACVAMAVQQRPLPAFHYQVARFGGGDVRCTPYAMFGSPKLGALAVDALQGRNACLLGNHGMICHGRSIREAMQAAELLEVLSLQYLLACSAGAPRLLTEGDVREALARYASYASA